MDSIPVPTVNFTATILFISQEKTRTPNTFKASYSSKVNRPSLANILELKTSGKSASFLKHKQVCIPGWNFEPKVCQIYDGMSSLWRFVKLIRVWQTYEGLSHLWWYVTLLKVCHISDGMSNFSSHVTLMKVCQTFEGMSNLWRYIKLMKDITLVNIWHTFEDMSHYWM